MHKNDSGCDRYQQLDGILPRFACLLPALRQQRLAERRESLILL
ncbi:TPA: hypothetical protein ACG354_000871 [Escherichia coli]